MGAVFLLDTLVYSKSAVLGIGNACLSPIDSPALQIKGYCGVS